MSHLRVVLVTVLSILFVHTPASAQSEGSPLLPPHGDGSQFEHYMFGPTFFDAPIAYAQPQDRGGGLNAVAALWVVGIGSVYDSLEVGQHTLVYTLNTVLGDSHFTYNITVVP